MSFQNLSRQLDLASGTFLARLTSVQTGTGAQAGLNLYGFVEQQLDDATGLPQDATPGRTDNLQTGGTCYAVEVENQVVPGLTSTPAAAPTYSTPFPSPLGQPYVWMKQKGVVLGSVIYEFTFAVVPLAWVKVTSTTPITVTLPGGSLPNCFAAQIQIQNQNGTITAGATVWYHDLNTQAPTLNQNYQCRFFENSTSNVQIWETALPAAANAAPATVYLAASTSNFGPAAGIQTILSYTIPASPGGGLYLIQAMLSASLQMVTQSTAGDQGLLSAWILKNGAVQTPPMSGFGVAVSYSQEVAASNGTIYGTASFTSLLTCAVGDVITLVCNCSNSLPNGTIARVYGADAVLGPTNSCPTGMTLTFI